MQFNLKGKNILLFGSTGILGSEYTRQLIKNNVNLVAIDIFSKNFLKLKNIKILDRVCFKRRTSY